MRRRSGVDEVVEVQHSVYGNRLTANLGLDLAWLKPLIRWIPRPSLGPHAHDCLRWIRVGLADTGHGDRWWSYDEDDTQTLRGASAGLADGVMGAGLEWLVHERKPQAFLRHAQRSVERSKSLRYPEGGFLELRLLAAVHAWMGEFEVARGLCAQAGERWEEEKARLAMARTIYRRRHPRALRRLAPVPNLQAELERITEPTTAVRVFRRVGARIESGSG